MANAAYVGSSFGDVHYGTRVDTTVVTGTTPALGSLIVILFQCLAVGAPTAPTGFAEHPSSPFSWNGGSGALHLYTKIAGGAESGSYTVTHTLLNTFAAAWVVSNVNSTGTIDFVASGTTTAGQDPNASGTTSEANVLLFACFTYTNDAGTTTEPAGFTEVGDDVNTFGVAHKLQAAAGGTGTITYDTTVNDNAIMLLFGVKSESATFAIGGHIQAASVNANDVTTGALDTTGANLFVAHVSVEVGGGTFSDSKGNTWNIAVGPTSSSRADSVMYWCIPTSVGSGHTFTYSKTGDSPNLCVQTFSASGVVTVDQTNSNTATSAANIQPGSITPSVNNCLVVSAFGHDNGTVVSVDDYVLTDTNGGAGGQAWGASMAYQIQTTATATNPLWTTASGSADSATIVSFKVGALTVTPSTAVLSLTSFAPTVTATVSNPPIVFLRR